MANQLDVGRLRLLREVGLRGSIAGAARAVGLTASAVSQQLSTLEREAGTPLLDRSSRGVALTGAGHALAARAGQVLDLLAAAGADLDRLAGRLAGPVRVAAVASAAATIVSAAVTDLRSSAPGIEVSVLAAEPDHGIGLLLSDDVDVAVVDEYDHVPLALPETADVLALTEEPLVLVTATGHAGRRCAIADLAGADWVMPPESAACGRAVRAACRIAGFEPQVRWHTDDMALLARAVADGHGVAVLPRRSVVTAVGVRTSALRGDAPRRRLLAVTRNGAAQRPVVGTTVSAIAGAANRRSDVLSD